MVYPFLIRYAQCSSNTFPIITEEGVKGQLVEETGWDRVKRMYSSDEFGYSPELNYVINTGKIIFITSAFFGGYRSMVRARGEFFRKNMATTWESQHLARRNLADTMSLALLKGGAKSALKYGSFSTLYLLSTITAANYRNKISVWEHIASGAALGAVARINYGLKGFVIAGALGGFLGLIAGGLITLTMGVNGMNMDEFRSWLHQEHLSRIKKERLNELKEDSPRES